MVVVAVAMFVAIQSKCASRSRAKKRTVFGGGGYDIGCSVAAHMTVETDDAIGGGHHNMQVVADHQNGTSELRAHVLDLLVKRGGPGLIETLCGFVENKQVWFMEQSPCKEYALKLSPERSAIAVSAICPAPPASNAAVTSARGWRVGKLRKRFTESGRLGSSWSFCGT
ncbi:hypothetical protein RC74_09075 [Falsihalocynthiibacter arcticus]|uniref:Uncharacterized protein n=1 Tax=Falsihalocynthiibacter arcticus TaxID=1579316 RepID=A0A126UZC4_9RHOB|nr:hypothetical protein RC74_09075 [Falsihalocynthiibacter arcticus]